MLKIRLFCAAGMSTSMLMAAIQRESKAQKLEVEVSAFPVSDLKKRIADIDVALLGPQVSYAYEDAKKICDKAGKPIAVIPVQDYGMMNGRAVLVLAKKLAGQ